MKPFLYIGRALGVVAFLLFIPPLVEYLGGSARLPIGEFL